LTPQHLLVHERAYLTIHCLAESTHVDWVFHTAIVAAGGAAVPAPDQVRLQVGGRKTCSSRHWRRASNVTGATSAQRLEIAKVTGILHDERGAFFFVDENYPADLAYASG